MSKWNDSALVNVIICCYENYAALKSKYPKKYFAPDAYCPPKAFFYINRLGRARYYKINGELWDIVSGNIIKSKYIKTRYKVRPLE